MITLFVSVVGYCDGWRVDGSDDEDDHAGYVWLL